MDCVLVLASDTPNEKGKYVFTCLACKESVTNRNKDAVIKRICGELKPPPGFGPGTELTKIIHNELGYSDDSCNSCKALANLMDRLGVERTRAMRSVVVENLRNRAHKKGWASRIGAASKALKSGLAFRLDPLDIYGSLVDEALRRASLNSTHTPS